MNNGKVLKSETHRATGDPETPLSDDDIRGKYYELAIPVVGEIRARKIESIVSGLNGGQTVSDLLAAIEQAS